jgi:O-antigen ligase
MLWLHRPLDRGLGAALTILSTVAMTLTYTRSMLLTSGVVVGGLVFLAWARGKRLRAAMLAGILGMSIGTTIYVFELRPIYLDRINTMTKSADIPHDANISSRLEEYRMAWEMFLNSPIVGQGLGIKHDMHFTMNEGESLHVRVGYVHNWVMYMLMIGGVVGLTAYSILLLSPAVLAWRGIAERELTILILATVAAMVGYGLFFAVFRLIPFNLLLGGIWALLLAHAKRNG